MSKTSKCPSLAYPRKQQTILKFIEQGKRKYMFPHPNGSHAIRLANTPGGACVIRWKSSEYTWPRTHALHLVWMKLTTNESQYPWLMNVFGWHWQPPNNHQANINHSTSPIRSRPRARNVLSLTAFWRVVLKYKNKRKDKGRTSTSRPEMAWALRKVQRDRVWFVTFGYRLASFSNQRKSRWHPVHKAKHKLIIESWMAPDFVPSWGATPLLTSEHSAAKTVDAKSRINRWQLTCIARSHQFEVLEMYSTTK